MKNIITNIKGITFILLLFYFLGSLMWATIDIRQWDTFGRVSLFSFALFMCIVVIAHNDKHLKE